MAATDGTMPLPATTDAEEGGFATALLDWYDRHGRKDLPWQHPRSAYRVWISEVMLQQTQVRTVIPYFLRFVDELPDLTTLAGADEDRVLALWSGLGYYSRARNLHRAARLCMERHGGDLPRSRDELADLPGIGRSTAAAILAQAFGEPHAILDGNVRRVLARWHGVQGWPGAAGPQRELWRHAESHTPTRRVADYTQAIMDLGAAVCTRSSPACTDCPIAWGCRAFLEERTGELPAPRPQRTQPVRATTMLVARDTAGRILLERRPPAGVWARLWSLPEAASTTPSGELLRRHGIEASGEARELPGFIHVFSHYRLQVTPLLVDRVRLGRNIADPAEARWLATPQWRTAALPAPVRRLLESLEHTP